jgi:hypothetical protein
MVDNFREGIDNYENLVFVPLSEVHAPKWPDEVLRVFQRDYPEKKDLDAPWAHFFYLRLQGTTFSGQDIRTTLGNTLRALVYRLFDLWMIGVPKPWRKNNGYCFVAASGDDTIAWIIESLKELLEKRFETAYHYTKNSDEGKGLG